MISTFVYNSKNRNGVGAKDLQARLAPSVVPRVRLARSLS